jgi:hypothetical protein
MQPCPEPAAANKRGLVDGRRHTLSGTRLGWGVAALCLFDAAAGDIEANPIGARLIQNGWACVWVLKVAAVIAFLCAVTRLLQTRWGRALVYTAAAAYAIVALLHLVFFVSSAFT